MHGSKLMFQYIYLSYELCSTIICYTRWAPPANTITNIPIFSEKECDLLLNVPFCFLIYTSLLKLFSPQQMSHSPFVIPVTTSISSINCQVAFAALTPKEALYCYQFAKAAWNGGKICFFQRSYESPALLYIILRAFEQSAGKVIATVTPLFEQLQLRQALVYIGAFLDNCGNYKSFGDSKFIPECSPEVLRRLLLATPYWAHHQSEFEEIYSKIEKTLFMCQKPYQHINFKDKEGTTGYYSANVTLADAQNVKQILTKHGFLSQNTRLIKTAENHFTVKVAAEEKRTLQDIVDGEVVIKFQCGQFGVFLKRVSEFLTKAKEYCANENQAKMIEEYVAHFRTGEMERHKESQRWWIKDKQPVIETNIGFIESYLDPLRVRAQFEGFVAVVNKKESELLTQLVNGASDFLKYLPWGEQFEVQVFKKPDFTSLEVLAFACSGIPAGINIPNYDDIREKLGSKNVNLGNAYGDATLQSLQYTPQEEKPLHLQHFKSSFFVIVALHELLGHGSGKLFHHKPDFNSPLDNMEITTFYKDNETWHGVFGQISSTYEECKADCVALYLALFEDIQKILLPENTPQERLDVVYAAWFHIVMGGLKGLQLYEPSSDRWLQPHIGASFAIFKVLQQAGGIFDIVETEKNGQPYLQIHLNRAAIFTKGKQAIGEFLRHLQIYKSTANVKEGLAFFQHYLKVDEQLIKYRQIVLKNKRPRRLTVQPDLIIEDGVVKYVKFEANIEGLIDSTVSHFSEGKEEIIAEWLRSNQEFIY